MLILLYSLDDIRILISYCRERHNGILGLLRHEICHLCDAVRILIFGVILVKFEDFFTSDVKQDLNVYFS